MKKSLFAISFIIIAGILIITTPSLAEAETSNQTQIDQMAGVLKSLQNIFNELKQKVASIINSQTQTAQVASLTTGLVGHWKFDEGTGLSAVDSSGNNNTGTLVNGPTWTTGKIGGALNFDGVDDYVNMGIGSATESIGGGSAVSVSLWIKINDPNNTADKMIISKFQNAASKSTWNLIKDNIAQGNNLYFQVWNTAGADVVATSDNLFPTDANWHHVVGVYD